MRKQTKLAVMLASVALLVVSAASIVSARGWVQQGGNWYYQNADGDFVTETMQNSNNSKFYLGEDGAMVTDYFLEDYGDGANCYYFGSNGAMVTNTWVAIDPAIVSNQGDYVPTVYWYYFGATGKATKASDNGNGIKKVTIDGKKYAFNSYGQMLTGWIDYSGAIISEDEDDPFSNAVYYAGGDNDGVLRSGWLTYYDGASSTVRGGAFDDRAVLYFYFKPSNNVKMGIDRDTGAADVDSKTEHSDRDAYKTKKINGRTYAFDGGTGVMLAEWDGYYKDTASPSYSTKYYFSAEDDGHQVKKGWIYTVPDERVNPKDYKDDEERYMYFSNSGDIVEDQIKKINGKYYGFDDTGVMKTGLVMYYKDGKYAGKLNGDNTKGEELSKRSMYRNGDNDPITFYKDAQNGFIHISSPSGPEAKIHYFGSDGARRTGANVIEFADDSYTFSSDNNGHYEATKKKKFYSNGILLKANTDLRYGIITKGAANTCVDYEWASTDYNTNFFVLNTGGSEVKGATSSKKDADGNFWLVAKNSMSTNEGTISLNELIGIWSVDVRIHKLNAEYGATNGSAAESGLQFKADSSSVGGNEQANRWLNGDNGIYPEAKQTITKNPIQYDSTGRTVTLSKRGHGTNGSYAVDPTNEAALNFIWTRDKDNY